MKRGFIGILDKRKWVGRRTAPTFLLLGIFLGLTACDELKRIMRPELRSAKVDDRVDKAAEPAEAMTPEERFSFYRWLVVEMQQQIFSRPGVEGIDEWANVLSQRGSIEGVYHGLILSSRYAAAETGKADLKAVRFFAQEMAALDHPNLKDSDEKVRISREAYAKRAMGHSVFTLKRLLGEKILQQSHERRLDKDRLAAWYAAFAARWAGSGVSFGMKQRNLTEEAFHYRWAQRNTLGMIQWELLNRAHRILNAYGGIANPVGK